MKTLVTYLSLLFTFSFLFVFVPDLQSQGLAIGNSNPKPAKSDKKPADATANKTGSGDPDQTGAPPADHPAWKRYQKAEGYYFQGKDELALLIFEGVQTHFAEYAPLHMYMGDLYLKTQEYQKARRSYSIAISLQESIGHACLGLGHALYGLGDGRQAVKYYAAAYQADPKIKIALWHKGLAALVLLRDKDKTIGFWEEYLKQTSQAEDKQYDAVQKSIDYLKGPDLKLPTIQEMPDRRQFLEFLAQGQKEIKKDAQPAPQTPPPSPNGSGSPAPNPNNNQSSNNTESNPFSGYNTKTTAPAAGNKSPVPPNMNDTTGKK